MDQTTMLGESRLKRDLTDLFSFTEAPESRFENMFTTHYCRDSVSEQIRVLSPTYYICNSRCSIYLIKRSIFSPFARCWERKGRGVGAVLTEW